MDDEQGMELEALAAIYMDDYQELERQPYPKFTIQIRPNDDGQNNFVGLTVEFTLPLQYPSKEIPRFEFVDVFGLNSQQCETLEEKITKQAEGNLGMPMIYDLVTLIKSFLEDNNIDEEARMKAEALKEEEERQRKRAEGTPVTPETFAKWKEQFYANFQPKRSFEVKLDTKGKLTGRQLFERNKDLFTSDANEEGEDVSVDWSVFSNELDNLDLEGVDEGP